jgi:hypothetical protein
VIAHFKITPYASGGTNVFNTTWSAGVWARDTSGGKVEGLFFGPQGTAEQAYCVNIYTWSALNTYVGNPNGNVITTPADGVWVKIEDTGTALQFYWSQDGVFYVEAYQDSYVPSQGNVYGFGSDPTGIEVGMMIDSFDVH